VYYTHAAICRPTIGLLPKLMFDSSPAMTNPLFRRSCLARSAHEALHVLINRLMSGGYRSRLIFLGKNGVEQVASN
jgi:hypothetical protein